MKKRHINIPIFIPHEGCPNNCVFCNQHTITQTPNGGSKRDIKPEIEKCLETIDLNLCECEIAFFGGSFTGIPRNDMIRLLKTAYEYIKNGKVCSIRLSTRPDFIDDEILNILEQYGVRHIELGIQSFNNSVLAASQRGHNAETSRLACKMIVKRGFSLTGQMMIGLPGATLKSEIETAKEICALGADSARIYPTVVFHNTELCNMSKQGIYTPLTNQEAVERCAEVYKIFAQNNVKLLRIGLQASEGLNDENVYGGANHSAVGEMTISRYYFDIMREICLDILKNGEPKRGNTVAITILCAEGETSKVAGQKRSNKEAISKLFCNYGIKVCKIKICQNKNIQKNNVKIITEVIKKRGDDGCI